MLLQALFSFSCHDGLLLLEIGWLHMQRISRSIPLLLSHCFQLSDLNLHAPRAMELLFCLPNSTSANTYLLTFHRGRGSGNLVGFVTIHFISLSSFYLLKTRVQKFVFVLVQISNLFVITGLAVILFSTCFLFCFFPNTHMAQNRINPPCPFPSAYYWQPVALRPSGVSELDVCGWHPAASCCVCLLSLCLSLSWISPPSLDILPSVLLPGHSGALLSHWR